MGAERCFREMEQRGGGIGTARNIFCVVGVSIVMGVAEMDGSNGRSYEDG